MRYIVFILSACALSVMMVKITYSHSLEYRAGRVAAHIDYCGRYDLNRALYNKYGKSEDYENGKLDTSIQNGGGESHEERHLHCDEVEDFTEKLLNASAQEKASKSKAYNAGRAATIIDEACGRYGLSEKLYNEFGSQSDFKEGQLSLSFPHKNDTSIDCDAIESWIGRLLERKTDALEAIAKREEERKKKAKRFAKANRIKNPDAIAVIIGNRDYKGSTPDVDFAGNDADAMKNYIRF